MIRNHPYRDPFNDPEHRFPDLEHATFPGQGIHRHHLRRRKEVNLLAEIQLNMNVICMEEEAFYALIEKVVERLNQDHFNAPNRWIDRSEAMKMLQISSTTTLQQLRDNGKIRYSQPSRKIIHYDRESIEDYLEKHAREVF